jgi:hypothetical protein
MLTRFQLIEAEGLHGRSRRRAGRLGEQPVETAVRALANRSLVVPDQEETAFALVPMVADFLRASGPRSSRKSRAVWSNARMR